MSYPRVRLRYVLAICGAIGVLGAVASFGLASTQGIRVDFGRMLGHGLLIWLLYGVLSPVVLWTSRRFPLEPRRMAHHLPAHAAALLMLSASHTLIYNAAMLVAGDADVSALPSVVRRTAAGNLRNDVFVYAIIAGGYYLYGLAMRSRERERALANAKLEALTSRLQPHFLFNTLNSISTLVLKGEREEAVRMVSRLSDLLRTTLSSSGHMTVPFQEELALVRQYLAIEAVRFPDRLRPTISVPTDLLAVPVPVLMVQTLVENAVRHGIASVPEAGVIEVRAARGANGMWIEVRDDGRGPSPSPDGVGFATTRERLQQLYGSRAKLTLLRGAEGGSVARLDLPL